MKTSLQIIQNYESQDLPCVIITIDSNPQSKYIFNMPETTQRFASDHKINFIKGQIIFLTRLEARALAGLPGMMCTLNLNDKSEQNKIYGPDGLVDFFEDIKYLMFKNQIQFSACDLFSEKKMLGINKQGFEKMIEDDHIIHPNLNLQENLKKQKNDQYILNDASLCIDSEKGFYKDQVVKVYPIQLFDQNNKKTYSYILQTKKIQGNVNKQKLQEAQIPKQLMSNFMKNGLIKLDDGREFYLQDFKENETPSQLIFILDIQEENQLQYFQQNEFVIQLLNDKENNFQISCVIHLNYRIQKSSEYNKCINKLFSNKITHIFCKEKLQLNSINDNELRNQVKGEYFKRYAQIILMHKYFAANFPNIEQNNNFFQEENENNDDNNNNNNLISALPYFEFDVLPLKKKGHKCSKLSQNKKIKQEDNQFEKDFLKNYQKENIIQNKISDWEIIFLGTGSMLPLQNRTVSAIYVKNQLEMGILLDIGEGTYQQFIDHYGRKRAEILISKIDLIIISHIHLDHNMGLLFFLEKKIEFQIKQNLQLPNQTFIVCPYNMASLLAGYMKIHQNWQKQGNFEFIFIQDLNGESTEYLKKQKDKINNQSIDNLLNNANINFIEFEHPLEQKIIEQFESQENVEQFQNFIKFKLQIKNLTFIPVVHCSQSYGILFEYQDSFKFCYSGDTRPCEQFIKICQNVDLMIHEATFTDDLAENALKNQHSTISEALQVGMKSKSKNLILTHFSQRYKRVDVQYIKDQEIKNYFINHTIMALDHLEIQKNNIKLFPQISRMYENLIHE